MVAEQVGQLLAVLAILVDPQLHVLAELLVKLLVVLGVLCDLVEELETLLDNVLADDLEDLALLENLTRDVERKILRIHNSLHKVEILGNKLLAVFHDEHSPHVQFDVVLDLPVLKQVKRGSLRDKEQCAELELAFDREVLHGEVVFPVVGEGLVKLAVLCLGDVIRVAGPDGLHLVQLLQFVELFLDLFLLLLVLVLVVLLFIVTHILKLGFILTVRGNTCI